MATDDQFQTPQTVEEWQATAVVLRQEGQHVIAGRIAASLRREARGFGFFLAMPGPKIRVIADAYRRAKAMPDGR
jgi:hypothetical protein